MTVWVVRATAPGLASFADHNHLALNCLVSSDLTGLDSTAIAALGPSRAHSRELSHLPRVTIGDLVVATDSASRNVLVGRVTGNYAYRPDLDVTHPHTRPVTWGPQVRRTALTAAGLLLPGIHVKALGELPVAAAIGQLLEQAADGRLEPAHPAPTTPAQVVPADAPSIGWLELVGRRLGHPASWADEQIAAEELEECRHTIRPCGQHTRHRYWLSVPVRRPSPDGPNVLVVGANPTCPDEPTPGNTTVNRVVAFADLLSAASIGMVNVASRRTQTFADLRTHPVDDRWGPRQEPMLRRAMGQADVIVVAWGNDAASWFPDEAERVSALLLDAQTAGAVVVDPFGRQRHPRRWPTTALDATGQPHLLSSMRPWSR